VFTWEDVPADVEDVCDNLELDEFWVNGDPAYVVHLITTREDGSEVVEWEVSILISTKGCVARVVFDAAQTIENTPDFVEMWEGWQADGNDGESLVDRVIANEDLDSSYNPRLEEDPPDDDHKIHVLPGEVFQWELEDGTVVLFHTDIEVTGSGSDGDIIQLSSVAVVLQPDQSELKRMEWDCRIKPRSNAEWSAVAVDVHGVGRADFEDGGRYADAKPMVEVWPEWVAWCEAVMAGKDIDDKQRCGCFVAWLFRGVGWGCL
jgi:hypothetical protein